MQKRSSAGIYFLFFLALSLITLVLSQTGIFKHVSPAFQSFISPIQSITFNFYSGFANFGQNPQIELLKQQNLELTKKFIDQTKLAADNKALSDQFQTQNPKSPMLIPSSVIGAPGFIPGVSVPENLILDRGESDGIKVGDAVVYQDNLMGKIIKTSANLSEVMLITNISSSFTAKTLNTQSLGVINGQGGGEIILDNVVLSDTLQKQDTVLTKGNIGQDGNGFPPDLIVGKISSISKNPSDLFQKAEVKSLVDFTRITKVFVIKSSQ